MSFVRIAVLGTRSLRIRHLPNSKLIRTPRQDFFQLNLIAENMFKPSVDRSFICKQTNVVSFLYTIFALRRSLVLLQYVFFIPSIESLLYLARKYQ